MRRASRLDSPAKIWQNVPHRRYQALNCKVSELYPYDKEFGDGFLEGRYSIGNAMKSYRKHCKDEAFFNRCTVFLILRKLESVDCVYQNIFAVFCIAQNCLLILLCVLI